MQLAQRVGMFDGDFGRKLTAAAAGADLFASGAAVDVSAALEFDQIAAVADDGALLHEFGDRFHRETSVSMAVGIVWFGSDWSESNTTAASASATPEDSRQPRRS